MLARSFLTGAILIGTVTSFATATYFSSFGSDVASPKPDANQHTNSPNNIPQLEKFKVAERAQQAPCRRTQSCRNT